MQPGQVFNLLRMASSQIVGLERTLSKVAQKNPVRLGQLIGENRVAAIHHQFPIPLAHGPLPVELPVEDFVRRDCGGRFQHRKNASPVQLA